MKMFVFPTPDVAKCELRHDQGWTVVAVSDTHPSGRPGKSFTIPPNTPNSNGATLIITADKNVPINLRGILIFGEQELAYLLCDDFRMQAEKECPPPVVIPPQPQPPTAQNPKELVESIGKTADLTTKEGCGKFTEECCKQLHEQFSDKYGHLRKTGAQNQYNGHAVDAINLLSGHTNPDGTMTPAGVYDIIFSSESPEAAPRFNLVGPAAPALWYYPA